MTPSCIVAVTGDERHLVLSGLRADQHTLVGLPKVGCGSEAAAGFNCLDSSNQPLVPTYRGCLQSKEDAVYLLEACLRGELNHSCRGPHDGEATVSGNIFVWEANISGIDCWRDGMEWTFRQEDGFEVGEAMNGSGLTKKTISIPVNECLHHVVSYYTTFGHPGP
jgi:Gti1/Pac2 family